MALLLHMPLAAIRAAVIDTETTGLDTATARIIEIAAVHLDGPRVDIVNAFQSLVACPVPVPAAATAIHGITSAMLAGQPRFDTLWPGLLAFLRDRVWIGHSIGFDLAMVKRECALARLDCPPPLALDLRLLAQIAEPNLPTFALDAVATWLGVTVQERHRALGDAETTARSFVALVSRLKARGIHTVAEALRACQRVVEAMPGSALTTFAAEPPGFATALDRIDSYPYRHRVREVMSAPPVFLPAACTLRAAIEAMASKRLSAMLLGEAEAPIEAAAIITERDTLRAIASHGAAALELPALRFASKPLVAVPEQAFLYRAIGRMAGRNIRHLVATGADGRITGMVSARDLLRLRASTAIALGDDIDAAPDVASLGRAWAKLPSMAEALLREEVEARQVAAVIARELGALHRRAAQLAEAEILAGDGSRPPCAYTVLLLGSAGRGESLLAMDQDNALLLASGGPHSPEDAWFARLGGIMNRILDEVGVPLCKGGVMAREPAYRGTAAIWRARIAQWLQRSRPEDLLSVDIVFDLQPCHGDPGPAEALRHEAWRAARHEAAFLKLLAGAHEGAGASFGFFGGLRADEDGRLDLKKLGLARLVPAVRVLAIRHGILAASTADRLAGLRERPLRDCRDLGDLDAAHRLLLDLVLRQQIEDRKAGLPATNRVALAPLGKARQTMLRDALKALDALDTLVRDNLVAA